MSTPNTPTSNAKVDRAGMVASSVCAVHCLACALVPGALGALGLGSIIGHKAEWAFTLTAVGIAAIALWFGWRKHRSTKVAAWFIAGIVGLLAARGLESVGGDHHDDHHDEVASGEHHGEEGHKEDGHKEDGHKEDGHKEDGHKEDGHQDGHGHADEHDHGGALHMAGTGVGVLAGIFLLIGHGLNIREERKHEDCC